MRLRFFKILVLGLIELLSAPAFGQESIRFQQVTQVADLVNDQVISVRQDQEGFLWILSKRALKRYDGYEVRSYPSNFDLVLDEGLLLKSELYFDSNERVWVISGSLQPKYLDKVTGKFQEIPDLNSVTSMLELQQGVFLFGTLSGQLFQWDEAKKSKELVLVKSNQEIVKLLRDPEKEDQILILFKDEIGRMNTKTQAYSMVHSIPISSPEKFTTAYLDKTGKLWLGTFRHGLYAMTEYNSSPDPKVQAFVYTEIHSPILDIIEDKEARIWVSTFDEGIYVWETKSNSWDHFRYQKNSSHTLAHNFVPTLLEDDSGTIWIGTFGAGLSFYDSYLNQYHSLKNQNTPKDINLENIKTIYTDSSEVIWIGTGGKGLISYDMKSQNWTSYHTGMPNGTFLKSDQIQHLSGIGENLWISYSQGGLSKWNPQTGKNTYFDEKTNPSIPEGQILKVFPASADHVWLCTKEGGLLLLHSQNGIINRFDFQPDSINSFPDNHITELLHPEKEVVWVGTGSQGLVKLHTESGHFQQFMPELEDSDSQLPWSITSLAQGIDQQIWVGTASHGLWLFDSKTEEWKTPTALVLLKNSTIYGLSTDQLGKVWISTAQGVSSLESGPDGEYRLHHFGSNVEETFSYGQGVFFQNPDLGIFIGGFDQILFFNGKEIRQNSLHPKVKLTKLTQGKEEIPIVDGLRLSPSQNDLTFHFSTLSFSAPDQSVFQYRLLGAEDEWRLQQGINQVSYNNLNPGDYQLEIRGSNYNGVWSLEPLVFKFQIPPLWYQTLFIKLILAISLAVMLFLIYQYLKFRWSMKVKLAFKDQEMERMLELDQLKSAFFGNISHEFRTPLALIMGPAERLLQSSGDLVVKSKLKLILENAKKLMVLTDKILAIKKVSSERSPLQIKHGNLSLLIHSVLVNFSYLSIKKEVIIKSQIPLITEVWFDSDKMEVILENTIYFAIEVAQAKSAINVEATLENQNLKITVRFEVDPRHRHALNKNKQSPNSYSEQAELLMKKKLIEKLVHAHEGTFDSRVDNEWKAVFRMEFSVDKYSYHPSFVQEEEEDMDTELRDRLIPTTIHLDTAASKILVVEDNKNLRKFLCEELGKFYEVIEAENGKTGLYEALKSNPDLILSDVMMPEMDGFEFCDKIKTNELTSHIPFILLTAKTEEESQLLALRLGVDDYIQKPFSFQKLALRIEKLIELRNKLRVRYASSVRIAPSEIASSSLDEKFLQKVQELVDDKMMESDFSIEQFCQHLGMSRMQLHRKLTALTGLSTSAFIRDQRLRLAVQKLEKTDETIAEIAYSVGFSSPSYFIKCFKESYQMTPMEYQKAAC